jgi:hypothetical protein
MPRPRIYLDHFAKPTATIERRRAMGMCRYCGRKLRRPGICIKCRKRRRAYEIKRVALREQERIAAGLPPKAKPPVKDDEDRETLASKIPTYIVPGLKHALHARIPPMPRCAR